MRISDWSSDVCSSDLIERTQLIALSGPNQRKRADRRTGVEPVMHATEGEEAARAQLQAGVDVRVTRVRSQMLVGTAAIKREDFLAGLLVDHRGRIGVLELVFPAAGARKSGV